MSEGLVLAARYRLVSRLGAGGMGSVWRAEDLNLGAQVAIKLIDPALADSTDAIVRFRREAQAAAAIRSTYVVQILDHGIDQGTPYIAMELLSGESLARRIERSGALSPCDTGQLLGHVGRALSLAHEHGIVHRDLKPDNIFLVREGDEDIGKVLDFGIARKRSGLADSGGVQTSTGAILGTPYYMSPEQATAQPIDHRTDIWSYGSIAFECLIGKRAFDGASLGSLFHSICMAPMPVPSQHGEVPHGFDAWFARATARDLAGRFQDMRQAASELRALCDRGRSSIVSPSLPGSRGDTVLSMGNAARARTAPTQEALGVTPPPSSHTVHNRKPMAARGPIVAAVSFLGLAAVGGYAISRQPARLTPNTASTILPLTPAISATPRLDPSMPPGIGPAIAVVPTSSASSTSPAQEDQSTAAKLVPPLAAPAPALRASAKVSQPPVNQAAKGANQAVTAGERPNRKTTSHTHRETNVSGI